ALSVSGGQGVSHYGGQGEPPLRGGCARVPRSKCPQPPVKGTWSETQVDDQGGSVLPAIMAHFLSSIDMMRPPRIDVSHYRRWDLNPHWRFRPEDFKSSASAIPPRRLLRRRIDRRE